MEEIDAIIFCTLKGIGCEFSQNETALANIAQETFVKAVIMCLRKIRPAIGLSDTIPRSMSARYQYGITVADACKKVGYKSDIGYQTILYGNVVDMRGVLMFLIEKLPKESENVVKHRSKRYAIIGALKGNLASDRKCSEPSAYPNCQYVSVPLETGVTVPGLRTNCTPAEWRNFCVNSLKYITEQPSDPKYLIPSLITLNASRLLNIYDTKLKCANDLRRQSRDASENIEITDAKDTTGPNTDLSANHARSELIKESKVTRVEELISENRELRTLIRQERSSNDELASKLAKIVKENSYREKALNVVNNPEIVVKLKNRIAASPDKLKRMNSKWSKYENEQKLILSELNEEINKRRATNDKLDAVYGREKRRLQSIFEDIKKKEDVIKTCRSDLESKSNYNSRSSYTQRILEIIHNIEKQKKEIDKNLNDTRLVQKEINSLDGKVERCFISIDELMFKVAKKDETIRKCYKLLAAIHSNSSSIIASVKQTGTIGREIKDLEEQIDNENARHTAANMQKLRKDLELVKNEQTYLLKRIGK